jgi:hypothetical protein
MPGVWEVRLSDIADTQNYDHMQAEKDEPAPPTAATLTVSAISADVTLPQVMADLATKSSGSVAHEITITNRMAAFNGSAAGMVLGSARRDRATIRDKQQLDYEIDVPAGSTSLIVRAANVADRNADLDVYVFNCTATTGCSSPQTDSDPFGDEIVTISNPAAGKWKVVIDAPAVPSGSTSFDYLDVVFNPSYGTVSSADLPKERKAGDSWTVQTNTWFASALPTGREPFPALVLQGQAGGTGFMFNIIELLPQRRATSIQQ